jgi:hypothetical protein
LKGTNSSQDKNPIKSTVTQKKSQTQHSGSISYGYRWSGGPGSQVVEVPEEQEIIRLIRQKRNERTVKGKSKSIKQITEELNEAKIPCGKGAGKWYPYKVSHILANKTD